MNMGTKQQKEVDSPQEAVNPRAEVLIAEDSPTQAEVLRHLLEQNGYAVRVANSGGNALSEVAKSKPDAIISDICMPGMDGYEFTDAIKQNDRFWDIPVILLTTLSDPEDIIRGIKARADGYLTKPYDDEYLLNKLESILATPVNRKEQEEEEELTVTFEDKSYVVPSDMQHFLDLVFSTSENAVRLNRKLEERTHELRAAVKRLQFEVEQRKLAEEKVRASLKEKEALLQEVHHRVKNNLQLVCSLLDLQRSRMDDERTTAFLLDSERRVRSMALIHEHLYRSSNLSEIDFSSYLDNLTKALSDSDPLHEKVVTISAVSEPIRLGVDTALPCGLIVNELVANCLKHAFDKGQKGQVRVEFRRNQPTGYVLVVADNGRGLPAEWDDMQSESLGLKLVRKLIASLRGKIFVQCDRGTEFTITFNDRQKGV
jgi:two-component sensor histidine kinase/CheY-like chemotaxis protein